MIRIIFFSLILPCHLAFSQINFVDRANILGLDEHTGNSVFGGSGASFVDFDNDGLDDITLATGAGVPVQFYKNINGQFFVETSFFTSPNTYNYRTRSACWVDYDNDGDKDFFLTSDTDGNRLFRRENNSLVDVTVSSGFPLDNLYTYGASWGDIDNDGCLDVYLSNRIGDTTITNYLFKNNCDGTFSEVTNSIGLNNLPALSFCSGFFDFNNDGWQDLYVANDKFKPNYLYKNNGDGTFTDVSQSSGTDVVMDAMSVTIDDFNADGFFDIYITNTPETISTPQPGCVLFKNNGDETFTNIAFNSGTDLDSFSWGSSFLDADNDSNIDLYVNTQYSGENMYATYAFYVNNGDETFDNSTISGFQTNAYRSYASAIGDYDNNGVVEILVNNDVDQEPSLWENIEVQSNNYISIDLEGTVSNKDAVGSIIEISVNGTKQYRHVMLGEGYLSQNTETHHFGIGNATVVDYIKIKWLSGIEDIVYNVSPNQKINIIEGTFLSVNEFNDDSIVNYYPNPVNEELFINSKKKIDSLEVFDITGRIVFVSYPLVNNTKINLSLIESGNYFAKLTSNGKSEIIKFIKK
ncbi:FG-GAP-like repeat-containing protein [Winogradskyella sp.]|uniref:FG-GAP-like repeat-containing protein n=1 Tax=unclassified Winogradskyella TaxID=2615021 RepID=UPI001B13FB1B|nr:FG-GAP-like repeat-containing protein [Winogradskyella sp.]MBO6880138.1 VCBS repeat-containing protein [Winogradskyella sp.]